MAYASITGAANAASNAAITVGGSAADEDRTKRSRAPSMRSRLRWARAKMA